MIAAPVQRDVDGIPKGPHCARIPSIESYMHELMPDVLEGRIEPGLVFDRVINIDGVPDGYGAMNDREAIKVMIKF
jgi:threonine dehydrogenase-like Zn-dependent dehydrogenase